MTCINYRQSVFQCYFMLVVRDRIPHYQMLVSEHWIDAEILTAGLVRSNLM